MAVAERGQRSLITRRHISMRRYSSAQRITRKTFRNRTKTAQKNILFGEQPAVKPSILKPLVGANNAEFCFNQRVAHKIPATRRKTPLKRHKMRRVKRGNRRRN